MRREPYLEKHLKGLINLDGGEVLKDVSLVPRTGGMLLKAGKESAGYMTFIAPHAARVVSRHVQLVEIYSDSHVSCVLIRMWLGRPQCRIRDHAPIHRRTPE